MKFLFNKKGMTIAELTVVLAVIAIVSTIVVSFSIMVHQQTLISNSKVDAVADIRVVENIIDGWIYRQEKEGYEISLEGNVLKSVKEGSEYTLTFVDNKIVGTLVDGDELFYNTSTIESIEYEIFAKDTDMLIICTINYYVSNGTELVLDSYIFCVNQYIGDIIA